MWDDEYDQLVLAYDDRLTGFAGAVVICLLLEALAVLLVVGIVRLVTG